MPEEYEIVGDDVNEVYIAEELMSLFCGEIEEEDCEPVCIGEHEWEDTVPTITADSGAGNHVLAPEDIPGYTISESAGSRAGRGFMGVSGDGIDNQGGAELNLAGAHGPFRSTFQVAKVNRPLMSIARICDKGHTVLFCKTHASVLASGGKEICRFARKGNLYMIDVTLKAPSRRTDATNRKSGFTRPGKR